MGCSLKGADGREDGGCPLVHLDLATVAAGTGRVGEVLVGVGQAGRPEEPRLLVGEIVPVGGHRRLASVRINREDVSGAVVGGHGQPATVQSKRRTIDLKRWMREERPPGHLGRCVSPVETVQMLD